MSIEYIVIHCAATPPSMDIGAQEIDRWHTARGWRGIGYNYVIRRDGALESGRAEGEELAHAQGYNRNSIAICLVGGVNEHNAPAANFTEAQTKTLEVVTTFMKFRYPDARICGHRDLPGVNKDCPSFDVRTWLARGVLAEPRKVA